MLPIHLTGSALFPQALVCGGGVHLPDTCGGVNVEADSMDAEEAI